MKRTVAVRSCVLSILVVVACGQVAVDPPAKIHRLKSCGTSDLCSQKLSKRLVPPQFMDSFQLRSSKCFCDGDCTTYGDCCIDRPSLRPRVTNGYATEYWGCVPTDPTAGVHGLVGCDGAMSSLCSNSGDDPRSDVAVFSVLTGQVFANVYCALCHGVAPQDITFAHVTVSCNQNVTDEQLNKLNYKRLEWKMNNSCSNDGGGKGSCAASLAICTMGLTGLPSSARYCVPSVSACSVPELRQACSSYSQPVVNKLSGRVYKNPHCALCYDLDSKSVSCLSKTPRTASLSIIMDFDWDFNTCHLPNTTWDGFNKVCVPIDCQGGLCRLSQQRTKCSGQGKMCPAKERDLKDRSIEGYLTAVVLVVSTGLLLLHNIIFYLDPKRQNVPSQVLKSLSWSLILGQLSFLAIDAKRFVPLYVCKGIAASTQLFYLASFFWMNVMSFDVWRTFSKVTLRGSSSSVIRKYNCYSWGCSLVVVGFTLVTDLTGLLPERFRPHFGVDSICWFGNKITLGIFLYFPVSILLLANLYLFGRTVLWFQKQTSKEFERVNNEATGRKEYHKVWLYIKLSTIMGLSWLFGIVSSLTGVSAFRYVFIFFNGLQGAFIFIMFDLKRKVFHQVFDNFKYRTSSSSSDVKQLQTKDTTMTHITRNNTSLSLKLNFPKK